MLTESNRVINDIRTRFRFRVSVQAALTGLGRGAEVKESGPVCLWNPQHEISSRRLV